MRRSLILAALAAAFALPALAADKPDRDAQARFRGLSDKAALGRVWPRGPDGQPIPGRVVLACRASAEGQVSDCQVAMDSAPGKGLGEAALKLAPYLSVEPGREDGQPVASTVVAAIDTFRLDTAGDWVRRPSSSDLLTVFPKQAFQRGRDGRAVINCLVSVRGGLYDCVVVYEAPPGEGFGRAALALTPQFLMKPATLAGQPVISEVSIPIGFKTNGSHAPGNDDKVVISPVNVWIEAPTWADVAAAYPAKARAAKVGGRATVACQFGPSGRPNRCDGISEEPKRMGFADAAKVVAKKFLARPPEGKSLSGAMVQLPVTFDPAMLDGGEPILGKPHWAVLPSADEMTAAIAALPKGLGSVRVTVNCRVEQLGRLADCKVTSEEPPGHGFGAAALTLTPRFQVTTWSNEGLPLVGGRLRIPLRFETGEPAPG